MAWFSMQLGADIAKLEAERPRERRAPWWRLVPGAFLTLVLAAGGLAALLSPGTYRLPDEPIVDGSWAQAYEDNFNEGLLFRELALSSLTALNYGLFGVGLDGVLVGEEGWLFTSEEFMRYPHEAAETAYKLALVAEVRETLETSGSRLVVALIPAKARVYEERLGRARLPDYSRARYEAFRESLLAVGVAAPDLLTPLLEAKAEGQVFLRTDTHWTPFGAQVVAQALRPAVAAAGASLDRGEFVLVAAGSEPFSGDLFNFLPLGPWQERLGPPPDRLERARVREIDSGLGDDLFGELTIPVALVGTSYSGGDWQFRGALEATLGLSVLDAAQEGLGPVIPMLRYLADPAFESPPEVVIWEIPERYLPVRYDLSPYGREGLDREGIEEASEAFR
ncbi:MAG: alginate O-acetyltransferase [Deinococcota bacterium]|nr:alginate O-acetyltransferase [Deinococcota bacterium]